ncbi:hypothetical protein JCM10212_006025 [Sporobolomyces blumeae]
MAHYLDSFETFSSLNPTAQFDDPSAFLSGSDFDLDAAIFSDPGPIPSRTSGPRPYANLDEALNDLTPASTATAAGGTNPLGISVSSNSFALYDPDSPFNSPAGPASMSVKGMTRDGRFRTKLMGVGSDGGYLTSPLIVGKPRTDSRTGRAGPPEIAIDSPAVTPRASSLTTPVEPTYQPRQRSRTASVAMVPSLSMGSSASSAGYEPTPVGMSASSSRCGDLQVNPPEDESSEVLGMGISGVGDLTTAIDLGDYSNPNLKIFGMPKPGAQRQAKDGECGFLPYPEHMPTTTLGRGKNNVVDVGSIAGDTLGSRTPSSRVPTKFVEHDFLRSPPPAQVPLPPATQHRPKKQFPARTINKAKSCSALSASAKRQARADEPVFEPLTPVSAHTANFLLPHVPFNSPNDNVAVHQVDQPNSMPFSFSDLYNLGLANDAPDEFEATKKNPTEFAHELLAADGAGLGGGIGLGVGVGVQGGPQVMGSLGMLQPGGNAYGSGPGSAFSSPSTPYLSDPSPDIGLSWPDGSNMATSTEMFPADSMDSFLSIASAGQPLPNAFQQSAGRQRCATYGGVPSATPVDPSFSDSDLLSAPHHRPSRQRQPSAQVAYGAGTAKNFSYPTRFASQVQVPPPPSQQAPPMQWTASQDPPPQHHIPTTPTHPRTVSSHHRAATGPALGASSNVDLSFLYQHDSEDLQAAYDRNLEAFDSLFETYGGGGQPASAGKRGRTRDEDDDDPDYTLSPPMGGNGSDSRAKRLRSVASAPCLAPRRMRPGPKPKGMKSPQEQHQSVFSATLSPPIPQVRRATSPYASPLLSGGFTDDEGDDGSTTMITYTPGPPALPGQPRSSVPKEIIQSLYTGIPGHIDKTGQKVGKRYVCLIEGCERTFPRKSAIESHIQTHLEDKPFVCPHDDCDASFVRQHDLRRHERIHSGNKPFPCPCGKGFARGDALARHRARGICSGSLVPRRI